MYISNSEFAILTSLDNLGFIKRDMEKESMQVNSLGNEYRIIMERRSRSLFGNESNTMYKCSMRFVNMFGVEIVTLLGDEIEISKFSDTIYYFLESNNPDVICSMSSYNGNCFIKLTREYDATLRPLYNMIIMTSNNIPIAVLKFDDPTMSTLIDGMYFSFLIDIDDTGDKAHIYRYVDHDLWLADHGEELGINMDN